MPPKRHEQGKQAQETVSCAILNNVSWVKLVNSCMNELCSWVTILNFRRMSTPTERLAFQTSLQHMLAFRAALSRFGRLRMVRATEKSLRLRLTFIMVMFNAS